MDELEQLALFFKTTELPEGPIKLSKAETILSPEKFVERHLGLLVHHELEGKDTGGPYLERLKKFKLIIELIIEQKTTQEEPIGSSHQHALF